MQAGPEKTWAIAFDMGDEVIGGILAFARKQNITGAHFIGLGAFSRAELGYFDWQAKNYIRIPVDDQAEIVSLTGDIALQEGKPKVIAHAALAKRGGVMAGGHLLEGHVRPTLEILLTESPRHLQRRFDEDSGLALIRF